MHYWYRAQHYYGTLFHVPNWGPMPGPSPSPCPAGDCRFKLHISLVSKILRLQLQFNRLSSPQCAKWVHPFSLPWVDSNFRVKTGLPSLACHFDHVSYFCDYLSWLSPTKPGASPLDHICRNLHQRRQVWCQLCIQPVDSINLVWWCHRVSPYLYRSPDRYPALVWYVPDRLGVRCGLIIRWRLVGWGRGVRHALRCGVRLPGLLCCS